MVFAHEKKGVEIGRNGKVAMTPISTRKKKIKIKIKKNKK